MTNIRVAVHIDAAPQTVWAGIEDVASHVEWMAEAIEIRFRTEQRSGVGTETECDTRIGPFTTTDVFRFTEWDPPRIMRIEHTGLVTGTGRFLLEPIPSGTRFVWDENLTFPGRFGGPVAGLVAAPVIRHIWRANLRRLKRRIETQI